MKRELPRHAWLCFVFARMCSLSSPFQSQALIFTTLSRAPKIPSLAARFHCSWHILTPSSKDKTKVCLLALTWLCVLVLAMVLALVLVIASVQIQKKGTPEGCRECVLVNQSFQQISFANSITTTKGGGHVSYIANQVAKKLILEWEHAARSTAPLTS